MLLVQYNRIRGMKSIDACEIFHLFCLPAACGEYFAGGRGKITLQGGIDVKEEEKKPVPWEAVDPKPPVVQSGRMENRRGKQ